MPKPVGDMNYDDINDLFSEENEVKQKFAEWDKIGKEYSGYYVDKRVVPNKLKANTDQTLYSILQADNSVLIVAGRYGQPVQTFPGMEQTPLGALVGFKYEGDREASKPGFSPTKIIRTFVKKNKKTGEVILYPEMLAKFKGETMEETASPEHF